MAIVPPIYAGQIKHLVRQGYIVIFPEYNLGGFSGMFNDTNQYEQLGRAVDAVDDALALPAVASRAEMNNIYLASHSDGGNLSIGWIAGGGVPVKAMIMQHPCISNEAIPAFVRTLFLGDMVEIDASAGGPSITSPVIVVGGVKDTIAKPVQLNQIMNFLPNAASKVRYMYDEDTYGTRIASLTTWCMRRMTALSRGLFLTLCSGWASTHQDKSDDYRIHYAAVTLCWRV